MIAHFKLNIPIEKFFQDGSEFEIKRKSDYISYTEFLKYFNVLKTITRHNLIIGINFTYGWMPTIFNFRSEKFEDVLHILNKVKKGNDVNIDNLILLKGFFNNSLVGTTKILHFINPDKFAIYDSRVYRYLTNQEPNQSRIGNCRTYLDYLEFCAYLTKQKRFNSLKKKIERKVGYSMSDFRVVELIMYSKGAKINAK
jgi:hypothetical protein